MSSLYPTLEDMAVDHMQKAEAAYAAHAQHNQAAAQQGLPAPAAPVGSASGLYPMLNDFMGLELQPFVQQGYQMQSSADIENRQVAVRQTAAGQLQVAPITGNDTGLQRSEIKQGIRQVILCKDQKGKVGLRVRHVNKGVFVAFVHRGSPAALVGLRFGDQITQINGQNIGGWDSDKVHKHFKKIDGDRIVLAVRDRPFERTITMHKDSTGHIGFQFKNGTITAIVKDSSAVRNGVLTDHKLCEVSGQNVIGMEDKDILHIFRSAESPVTITIMPLFCYDHIMKCIGSSLVKKEMDHSIPDC